MSNPFAYIGHLERELMAAYGRFWIFAGRTWSWLWIGFSNRRNWRLLTPQMYEVGNRSVFVIMVTGLFVGLVLAVQSYGQLEAMGLAERLGVLVNLSVVKELGPVLAGVMLAGRVGGALVAELGTMNVTEQLDALRSMGTDPIRYLVVPRVLACMILTPILTIYADAMGALGGWLISVVMYGVASEPYWYFTKEAVVSWDIMTGFIKSVSFGTILALIACYKGFHCRSGAEGVGRACTEAFVATFIAILVSDFFINVMLESIYKALWGFTPLVGG
ncbi:MAG: putative phospholipid ABC transporter permease protein MlaE [Phycisphaerae bacterium]|nr:putative phospholipid ABC transporter permease protein MlaE [Phycisphaerae bacterium]